MGSVAWAPALLIIWGALGRSCRPLQAPKMDNSGAFLPIYVGKAGKVKTSVACRRELNFQARGLHF